MLQAVGLDPLRAAQAPKLVAPSRRPGPRAPGQASWLQWTKKRPVALFCDVVSGVNGIRV